MRSLIYHCCAASDWHMAENCGMYYGSKDDLADGFIHFSTYQQARTSATKHRTGQTDLVLLTVSTKVLGDALRWEASRSGQLFPHLYGGLSVKDVISVIDLPLGVDDLHQFPFGFPPLEDSFSG